MLGDLNTAASESAVRIECQRGPQAVDGDVLDLLSASSQSWSTGHFQAALGGRATDPGWPLLVKAFDPAGRLAGVTGAVPRLMSRGDDGYVPAVQLGFGAVRVDLRGGGVFPALTRTCLQELNGSIPSGLAYGFSPRVRDYAVMIGGHAVPEFEFALPAGAHLACPPARPGSVRVLDPVTGSDLAAMVEVYEATAAGYLGPLWRDEHHWRAGFLWSREDLNLCMGAWTRHGLAGYVRVKRKRSGQLRIAEAFARSSEPEAWLGLLHRLLAVVGGNEVTFTAGMNHGLGLALLTLGAEVRTSTRLVVRGVGRPGGADVFLAADAFNRIYLPHVDRL